MTHTLGRIVSYGLPFTGSHDLYPSPGPLGGPRFVILHFDNVRIPAGHYLEVPLGYGKDRFFTDIRPGNFWSRPVDTSSTPIRIQIKEIIVHPHPSSDTPSSSDTPPLTAGTARLLRYGSGEPTVTPNHQPGTPYGSKSNPDPFLHTDPYEEPIYETRLMCGGGHLEWGNEGCTLNPIPFHVKERVSNAVGLMVLMHKHGGGASDLSSCTGTLVRPDLFLTSRHCLTDPAGEDVRSASVTFEYETQCNGRKKFLHTGKFFKVVQVVAAGAPANGSIPPPYFDWVLLRLDSSPGGLPEPLQLRDTDLMPGETIFTVHHPNGAVKKFEIGVHAGGDTINGFSFAGGSSGSALFDIDGKLVKGPLSQGSGCSVTYTPLTPIRDWLSNPTPTPPRVPIDLILVIDGSKSMASLTPPIGRTKLEEAKDAASLFVQLTREGYGDRLGLVTFNTLATMNTSPDSVATVKPTLTGPEPFTTGQIGSIIAAGATSIDGGLTTAMSAFGSDSSNDRMVLLLTDGLQNVAPVIRSIEGTLGTTKLYVIGFGSDADLDGPFLSRIAQEHRGQFNQASDGHTLRKVFGLCFANIFETGVLSASDFVLQAGQSLSDLHHFSICGEEAFTLVLGWDNPSASSKVEIVTPKGKLLDENKVETARGKTWAFWRVSLPHGEEQDGTWHFTVQRLSHGGESTSEPGNVRYFFLIISSGGPKLVYLGEPRRVYTGDHVDPLVGLYYRNGTTPEAHVELTVDRPTMGLGKLVTDLPLCPPSISEDGVGVFRATLQTTITDKIGGFSSIPFDTLKFYLYDDGEHQDGAIEPDGIYNHRLEDITRTEGTYQFRAIATYGEGLRSSREVSWSIHVEPGIDRDHSVMTVVGVNDMPDGRHGTLVIVPRDRYDNPLGPGRIDAFTVLPMPGVKIVGPLKDQRDGGYAVSAIWDVSIAPEPGVLVRQLDRDPVVLTPSEKKSLAPRESTEAAENLLDCLGLNDSEVKTVKIKSVNLEVDLNDRTL